MDTTSPVTDKKEDQNNTAMSRRTLGVLSDEDDRFAVRGRFHADSPTLHQSVVPE